MKKIYNGLVLFVATGMFAGYIPFAAGTFGSMVGIILYYLASKHLDTHQMLLLLLALLVSGTYAAGKAENILREQDSSKIVIDEITGMYLTLFFIPFNLINIIICFIWFRVFDIIKPFPISYIDKHVHGGIGIMLDDIVAAIPANLLARLLIFFLEIISGRSL